MSAAKRFAAFVVLLAAGLGILRLVQGPGPHGHFEGDGNDTEIVLGPEVDGWTPRGALRVTQYLAAPLGAQRPTEFVLDAENSGPTEDLTGLFFEDVVLQYLDPETGAERMRLEAKKAHAQRVDDASGMSPEIQREIQLADVVVTIHDGAPIVPLTIEVPEILLDLDARTLRSEHDVVLSGPGLSGGGRGLLVDETERSLRIDSASALRLTGYGNGGSLTSSGALTVRRPDPDSDAVIVIAREDAWLGAFEEEPAAAPTEGLWAHEITLRGRDDEVAGIALSTIEAIGAPGTTRGVRYAVGANELFGGRAHLDLNELGEPSFARMNDEPRARLAVDRAALGAFQGSVSETADPARGVVLIESRTELTIRWSDEGTHVGAEGPATVTDGETLLVADGSVRGTVRIEDETASFQCNGGVRLERGTAVLVTRELRADFGHDDGGVAVMTVTASGRPLLTGASKDGRTFTLGSEGELVFRQHGDTWTIPSADRVELTVLGEERLHARADRITRFDPTRISLNASGNVQVETKEGAAKGETLVVESRDRFTLTSGLDERVTFESAEGSAEAGTVEREGDTVTLRERVIAHLTPSARAGEVYDIDCDLLILTRTEHVGAEGSISTFHLTAEGVREAAMRRPGEGLDLECTRLEGAYREAMDPAGDPLERFSSFHATGVERAVVLSQGKVSLLTRLQSNELSATRTERFRQGELASVEGEAIALGSVVFHGTAGDTPFNGTASEVRVDHEGTLHAKAAEGEKVFLSGVLPSNGKPYELEALWVLATPQGLEAAEPEIVVLSMGSAEDNEVDVDIHASALSMVSTPEWLELRGDVHVDGITEDAVPWRLEAGNVRFEGSLAPGQGVSANDISALFASQGVRLALPERDMIATGETLRAKRLSGLMRFEGVPARITAPTIVHEGDWIELDVNEGIIVGSGKGRIRQRELEDSVQDEEADDGRGWIEYSTMSLLEEPDALIYVLEEPRIHYVGPALSTFVPSMPAGELTISATWAVFWVDRHELREFPSRDEPEVRERPVDEPDIFDKIREFGLLNEVYLEGPVEIAVDGQPSASASAVYLDVVSGNGWLADAVFTITSGLVGRDIKTIKVHAQWLRQSDDDSFYADEAKVSLCEFEEPHLEITTGDLRITPSPSNPENFEVRLRDNRIRVYDLFTLPLPSIDYSTDEEGRPIIASLKLGNSARFGSFVSAGIVRPAEGAAEFMHDLLGRGSMNIDVDVDAQYSLDASWLGSRGVLLDGGFLAEADGEYRWVTQLGGIPDGKEDKGYIRVDENDRETLRLWLRTHGRYWLDDVSWLDLAGTWQTDAGVQAEFFESAFQRYEQSETYLRWRRAENNRYLSAAAVLHADDAFSGIDELPVVSAWQGQAEVLPLGPVSVTYGADAEAAYLNRHESEDGYASPFGEPAVFADGLGDRSTMRLDTSHRIEAPVGLGFLGLRATPFAIGRFTAWSEDETETDSSLRVFGQVGMRVATALWKPASSGGVHQLVPYISARRDVVTEEDGGVPVVFDDVEAPLEGEFLDAGVRGRIAAGPKTLLDLDLRATHVSEVPAGVATGWSEIGTFARLSIEPYDTPVMLSLDARYDVEAGDTLYSRLAIGWKPSDVLAFEAAHYRGLDLDREALFEAASVRGLYTWTPKWEFEGRQTYSLLDDGDRLGSSVILRRYGHDIVFELESSFREGEGASIGINLRPMFTFDRPDLGDVSF